MKRREACAGTAGITESVYGIVMAGKEDKDEWTN